MKGRVCSPHLVHQDKDASMHTLPLR